MRFTRSGSLFKWPEFGIVREHHPTKNVFTPLSCSYSFDVLARFVLAQPRIHIVLEYHRMGPINDPDSPQQCFLQTKPIKKLLDAHQPCSVSSTR